MSKDNKVYKPIIQHYEECLKRFGDSHLGVDWPKPEDAEKRYQVMLDIVRMIKKGSGQMSLLDFGCGVGHLLEYIQKNKYKQFDYTGMDISDKFISVCKDKFTGINFLTGDILEEPKLFDQYDLLVLNGVFTEKRELSFEEMFAYFKKLIRVLWEKTGEGLAFNVMSKHVDWERDDLFHLPFDLLADFLCREITRNFVIRNDYGLYEYTVYLYKK